MAGTSEGASPTVRVFRGPDAAPGRDPLLDDFRALRTTFMVKKRWNIVPPDQTDVDEYDRPEEDTCSIVVERHGRAAAGTRITRLRSFYGNSISLRMWQDCPTFKGDDGRFDQLEEMARRSSTDPSSKRLYDVTRLVTRYAALPDGHHDQRSAFAYARPDTLRLAGALYGVAGPGSQLVYTVEAGYAAFLQHCGVRISVLFEGVIGPQTDGTACVLCLCHSDESFDALRRGSTRNAEYFNDGLTQVRGA